MSRKDEKNFKKFLVMLVGSFLLIVGVAMILGCWQELVIFFKGVTGMILAGSGLLVLYSLSK
jgi:hypothetical protein